MVSIRASAPGNVARKPRTFSVRAATGAVPAQLAHLTAVNEGKAVNALKGLNLFQ